VAFRDRTKSPAFSLALPPDQFNMTSLQLRESSVLRLFLRIVDASSVFSYIFHKPTKPGIVLPNPRETHPWLPVIAIRQRNANEFRTSKSGGSQRLQSLQGFLARSPFRFHRDQLDVVALNRPSFGSINTIMSVMFPSPVKEVPPPNMCC